MFLGNSEDLFSHLRNGRHLVWDDEVEGVDEVFSLFEQDSDGFVGLWEGTGHNIKKLVVLQSRYFLFVLIYNFPALIKQYKVSIVSSSQLLDSVIKLLIGGATPNVSTYSCVLCDDIEADWDSVVLLFFGFLIFLQIIFLAHHRLYTMFGRNCSHYFWRWLVVERLLLLESCLVLWFLHSLPNIH